MKCNEMKDLLEALADGQAKELEKKTALAHVESCTACAKTLRWLSASKTAMRSVPLPDMPADLKSNLLAAARSADAARANAAAAGPWAFFERLWSVRPWQFGLAFAGAAAAVILIARLAANRSDVLPLDAVLAAHNEYERTMPLSSQEQLLSELPEHMAAGGAGR